MNFMGKQFNVFISVFNPDSSDKLKLCYQIYDVVRNTHLSIILFVKFVGWSLIMEYRMFNGLLSWKFAFQWWKKIAIWFDGNPSVEIIQWLSSISSVVKVDIFILFSQFFDWGLSRFLGLV